MRLSSKILATTGPIKRKSRLCFLITALGDLHSYASVGMEEDGQGSVLHSRQFSALRRSCQIIPNNLAVETSKAHQAIREASPIPLDRSQARVA